MRARTIAALSILALFDGSEAKAADWTVSAVDFLVAGASMVDTPVRVTRCNIANASSNALPCYAFHPGTPRGESGRSPSTPQA